MFSKKIKTGSSVFVGAPASPMDKSMMDKIAEAVASTYGITEAHLPQLYIPKDMEEPAQVLVIVPDTKTNINLIMRSLVGKLDNILQDDAFLDILPMEPSTSILNDVRVAGCCIFNLEDVGKH